MGSWGVNATIVKTKEVQFIHEASESLTAYTCNLFDGGADYLGVCYVHIKRNPNKQPR